MIVRFEKKREKAWLAVAVFAAVVAASCLGAAVMRFACSDGQSSVCEDGTCAVGGE